MELRGEVIPSESCIGGPGYTAKGSIRCFPYRTVQTSQYERLVRYRSAACPKWMFGFWVDLYPAVEKEI